jgi:NAD+ kinase
MGINLGTLGFLSAISPRDVSEAFTSVFVNNEYDSIKLDMLQLQLVRRGKPFKKWFALNDFVVLRDPRQPINIIDIYLDDQYIDSLHGDGMAIATPTGSTAYSLSCGGPIIAPDVPCILLTPISTHSLHARPMVFPILSGLTLRIKTPHDEGILSVDGQKHLRLHCEDSLHITKSGLKTTLITLKKYDFFSVLREKLKFGNDNR